MKLTVAFAFGSFVGASVATFIIGVLLSATPERKTPAPLPQRTLGSPTFHVGGRYDGESWTTSHI